MIIVTIGDIFSRVNDTVKILLFNQIVVQICCECKTPSVYFTHSFSVTWILTRRKSRRVLKVCCWIFMSLSPPQRPLRVVGKLRRMNWQRKRVGHDGKGKERKLPSFPLPIVPRALSIFRLLLNVFLLGYPSRVSAEELRVQVVLCSERLNILKERAAVLFDLLGFDVSIWLCLFVCFFSLSYIAYFTVTSRNETEIDLLLIQPFLLYGVNHVVLLLAIIFQA